MPGTLQHHTTRTPRLLTAAAAAAGLLLCSVVACQRHDFQAITPSTIGAHQESKTIQGRREKPFIMLVVDTSGSMNDGTNAAEDTCGDGNHHYVRGSTAACKWNDLRAVFADPVSGFLATSKDLALFGLTQFPNGGDNCGTGTILKGLDESNGNAEEIRSLIYETIAPQGGTPTAATLRAILSQEPLLARAGKRARFVMLLTDGMPNCNESEEMKTRCTQCAQDKTSCSAPGGCHPTNDPLDSCTGASSCLDEEATVAAVKALKDAGVETFVIGFGKGTATGDAVEVLNSAADAGGRARADVTTRYFQANNRDELEKVLSDITAAVQTCTFNLDSPPVSEAMLQLVLSENDSTSEPPPGMPTCPEMKDGFCALERGKHWRFTDASLGTVEILNDGHDDYCTQIQNAPVGAPLKLSFYYVTNL